MEDKDLEAKVQNYFLAAVLILAFVLVFLVFKPYISSLMLAMVLTVIFYPMQKKLAKLIHSNGFAAALSTLIVIIIIMLPIAFLLGLGVKELSIFAQSSSYNTLLNRVKILNLGSIDLRSYLQGMVAGTLNNLGNIFGKLVNVFAFIGITVITLFFFFKDGPQLKHAILDSLPLSHARAKKLSYDLDIGIRAVIGGYVLVATIQGVVSWVGYTIFGVDNPALWAILTLVAALIPSFGASVMYAIATLILLTQHHYGLGIGLFAWWILAVTIIDNFVGPKFISGRSKINIVLLLFSILGGLKLFGPIGFVIGPTIIIFFWSVLEMFKESGILYAPKGEDNSK